MANNDSSSGNPLNALGFFRLDASTAATLKQLDERLSGHYKTLVGQFYDYIAKFPEVAAILAKGPGIDRLKATQEQHMRHYLSGRFDESFVDQTHKIGAAHVRVGLNPSY